MADAFLTWVAIAAPTILSIGGIVVSIEGQHASTKRSVWAWRAALLVFGVGASFATYEQQDIAAKDAEAQSRTDIANAMAPFRTQIEVLSGQVEALVKVAMTAPNATPTHVSVVSLPKPKQTPFISKATEPASQAGQPASADLAHITFAQRQIASTDTNFPFEYQVIIQTDRELSHPHFAVIGSSPIGGFSFFLAGQGVMMMVSYGVMRGDPNSGELSFGFPAFTPDSPIVATVKAKQPWTVVKIDDLRGS